MARPGLSAALALVVSLSSTPSAHAQAPQQFKANIRMSGGSLSSPATGVMYFGGSKIRMELTAEGQEMVLIQDPASGSLLMVMPSQQMYMEMQPGMAPVSAPRARSMDPANPCSGGQATGCMALGDETVNGYATKKWQYEVDGESQTSWIATQLRFPVRIVSGDGTTTDYTNVTPGPQAAALFSPPSGFMKMEMGPITVMGMGRGGMPPAAMSGAIPPGVLPPGMDPAILGRMTGAGFDPAAMTLPPGSTEAGEVWAQGDGWIVDFTVTVSGNHSGEISLVGGSWQGTFSGEFKGSVPLTYGTPGAGITGAAVGPAWQLVPTLGSAKALATPATFSATTQYRSQGTWLGACPISDDGGTFVTVTRGTGQISSTEHATSAAGGTGSGRWQISPDLKTHQLSVGAGGTVTETTDSQRNTKNCEVAAPVTTNERTTKEVNTTIGINLADLPLPAAPGRMSGTGSVPLNLTIGGFTGEVQGNVQWTLRPIP